VAGIALLLVCPLLLGSDADFSRERARIAAMSPAEQVDLAKKQKWFNELDKVEQRRIRQLHQDIEQAEDAEQLREIMHRYCIWLETLPSETRFGLLEMSAEKRLEQIKTLRPQLQDEEVLRRWFDAYLTRLPQRKPGDKPPPGPRGERDSRGPDSARGWPDRVRRAFADRLPAPTEEEFANLRGQLSPATRKHLESQTPSEQWSWVLRQIGSERMQERINRRLAGPRPEIPDRELTEFFDGLSAETREELLRLPGNEMYGRLRELYQMEQKKMLPGGGFPRQGPGQGPPPDDRSPRPHGPPPQ
jgi:hypothetical protein